MQKKYPNLFTPIKIAGLTLKNRIEAAPTSLEDFTEREYTPRGWIEYYARRAAGGAAVVTLGETPVIFATGPTQHHMLNIEDPDIMPWLCKAADAIHQQGACASIELCHGGSASMRQFLHGNQAIAPSACTGTYDGEPVREMTEEMIWEVIEAFGNAAHRAQSCGLDMVMVHAGHGWLLGQFLSPATNRRTDQWGGSLDNRIRIVLCILENIKQKCGKDFPVEVRISGTEDAEGGYDLADGIEYCKRLDGVADLLHISIGTVQLHTPRGGQSITSPSFYEKRGLYVELAEEIKKHVSKTPVLTLGGLGLPEEMEEIIASGKADMVACARALIADPDLPKKAHAGKAEDIRPCLRCTGCLDDTMAGAQVIRCAVNPMIGRELEYWVNRRIPAKKCSVLVIGGGPAGMQAALAAAGQGHEVTLCEKGPELGGALLYNRDVSFKVDIERYRQWMIRKLEQAGVRVLLNTRVTPEYLENASKDVVICAIGAEPVVPPIPGVEGENVMLFTQAHLGAEVGKRAVIIGAGAVGCELGIHLAMNGHDVTIVEQAEIIVPTEGLVIEEGGVSNFREYTLVNLERYQVKTQLGLRVLEITGQGVRTQAKDGAERFFEADTVILAAGMKPLEEEREALRAACIEFKTVGDCHKVGRIKDATASGQAAGYYIG